MTPADLAQRFQQILRERTGGYLRNVDRTPGVTCRVCTAPVEGSALCDRCAEHRSAYGRALADLVVPVVYGGQTLQSQTLFYGYKDPGAAQQGDERRPLVRLMFRAAGFMHQRCIEYTVGASVGAVVTVPSTRQRIDHPLLELTSECLPMIPRIGAWPARCQPEAARTVVPSRFLLAPAPVARGRHVLVLDDTWATGARTQSMAVALREAGAAHVSILILARWLSTSWPPTVSYLGSHPHRDFDPWMCPVTGGRCVAPPVSPFVSRA